MKLFDIGHGVTCDIDRLVASRLLIQANSGGGKTRTLRRLLEQSHGRLQHLVIDPEGEYHTLREQFDYILAAPSGGDTVAHPRTAKLLAERLLQLGVSAILDIYELNPGDRAVFVQRFLDALVNAPRDLWHPTLVVLDEAHVYAPEGATSDCATAVKALASRGRKRGFCLVPATQRLAKLAKDVAAECNNKLIGRCTLDVDIKRAAEELGFTTAEQRQALRHLEPGEFYAFGPAFDLKAPQQVRVGAVTTTHAEAGQQAAPPRPPTDKVRKVLAQLADLPAEAEQRERTVAEMKARIVELERLLLARHSTPTERVEVLTDSDRELLQAVRAKLADVMKTVDEGAAQAFRSLDNRIHATLQAFAESTMVDVEKLHEKGRERFAAVLEQKRVAALFEKLDRVSAPPARQPGPSTPSLTMAAAMNRLPAAAAAFGRRFETSAQVDRRPAAAADANLGKAERAILTVLAQHPDGCEVGKLTLLSGYRFSGGFRNSLSVLRTGGLMEGSNTATMTITEAGLAAIGDVPALPTGDDLRVYWLNHQSLGKCERAILNALFARPAGLKVEPLCEATGYEFSGGFRNSLSTLRTAGLIVGKNTETMRAADVLLEGR